jgi:hypothetical protein
MTVKSFIAQAVCQLALMSHFTFKTAARIVTKLKSNPFNNRMTCTFLVYRSPSIKTFFSMEQRALKNVSNCLYTNVYSYLDTSGGISYNPYLNVVHFFNARVN